MRGTQRCPQRRHLRDGRVIGDSFISASLKKKNAPSRFRFEKARQPFGVTACRILHLRLVDHAEMLCGIMIHRDTVYLQVLNC